MKGGIFVVLFAGLATLPAMAQENLEDLERRLDAAKKVEATRQADAKRKADAERAAQARLGTLIVKADRDCVLSVNGEAKGELRAEQTKTVNVKAGQSLIECTGEGGRRAEATERIPAGEQVVIKLIVPPAERFTATADGVRDKSQGVVWAARDNGSDVNWSQAKDYCAGKGGGWSLPTSAQLQSLHDAAGQFGKTMTLHGYTATIKPATSLIDLTGFGYWSSESNGSSEAWIVDLVNGSRYSGFVSYGVDGRALCARRS